MIPLVILFCARSTHKAIEVGQIPSRAGRQIFRFPATITKTKTVSPNEGKWEFPLEDGRINRGKHCPLNSILTWNLLKIFHFSPFFRAYCNDLEYGRHLGNLKMSKDSFYISYEVRNIQKFDVPIAKIRKRITVWTIFKCFYWTYIWSQSSNILNRND